MNEEQTATLLSYRALDGRQLETVRMSQSGLALRATGYVISTGSAAYGASYSVVVDSDGSTRRVSVRCDDAVGAQSLSLTRSPGGPWIFETMTESATHTEIDSAIDIYLVGSAFTVSLPVRRLGLHTTAGAQADVTVASIQLPDLTVRPVVHSARTEEVFADGGARLDYTGPYGHREIIVDKDGLFVSTPGFSERIEA